MLKKIVALICVLLAFSVSISCGGKEEYPVNFTVTDVHDIYVPTDEGSEEVNEYPSMIKLSHQKNSEDNGKLLVTFEHWGNTYPVYESTDEGESWEFLSNVRDTYNEGYYNEWMPFLYELPCDMGEFSEGTIILAGTSTYGEGITDTTITLYNSTDAGKSFTAFGNVDNAGGLEWGVWEPYLIYDEESGRLFCFYSDDSDPLHSQKLVYKYTTDLVEWSEKLECVACEDPSLRPGTPVITKMGNGEYILVFEMVGIEGNPIYYKKTTSLDNWGDVSYCGEKVIANGKTFGSTPSVLWTSAGGENGTLIITGKHPIDGTSETGTDMFLSFDYGESFTPIPNPIPYSLYPYERCGYSPSLFVSEDQGVIYYVNNPPCHEKTYKITMAKIAISEKTKR